MSTLAFDTHKAVKALQAAGAAEPLAEAVVATVGEAVGANVATKADLAEVQAGLETEIAAVKTDLTEVKADLKTEIAATKAALESKIAAVKTDLAEAKAELKTEIAAVKTDLAEAKAELKTEIAEVRTEVAEVKAELKTDIALLRADTEKGFQGVYKFMMVSTLAIISTIIGGAIALVRYLAP